jgi:8-oxo-dGTP pyrophosphatase MutT (NUDIX family)
MKHDRYEAAGGVVLHEGAMLLLSRPSRNEVRLPKGHIDPGESPAEAALRETTEESGYADLEIVRDLGSKVVEFDFQGRHIVRTEHYFVMRLRSPRLVERDAKDDAQFYVQWAPAGDAPALLTFAAEQEVARRALADEQAHAQSAADDGNRPGDAAESVAAP